MTEHLRENFNTSRLSVRMREALRDRDLAALLALVKQGADVNQADYGDNTALILGVIKGDAALTQLLIDKGADLEKRNTNGHTPLMMAVFNNKPNAVRLLLDAGVDLDKKAEGSMGRNGTALSFAESGKFSVIAQMLREEAETRRARLTEATLKAEKARRDALNAKKLFFKQQAAKRKVAIKS